MENNNINNVITTNVVIVGAGPAGIATSACLNRLSISNIVLEKENCYASLWKERTYDRLKLHLGKQFCELPGMPYARGTPTFVPRADFISYLDDYVTQYKVDPRYDRIVEHAIFCDDIEGGRNWRVKVKNASLAVYEIYVAKFLVVATGENSEGHIPKIPGLDSFDGVFIHSSRYSNGKQFSDKNVLVVGCGNSGMEIAYDLSNWGANTSVVARSPVHVVTKEMVLLGMQLLDSIPCNIVDCITVMLSKLKYGDFSSYGLQRPIEGPFYLKAKTGRSPTIDVGAMAKIKKGEIKVFPSITKMKGNNIEFANGISNQFDAIVFATGYRSTVRYWLEGGEDLFNDNGMPIQDFPNNWKGENGLYCAGFARRGLQGISIDAQNIAKDINLALNYQNQRN